MLDKEAYDALIIAVGSRPIVRPSPASTSRTCTGLLRPMRARSSGEKTVIVGAGSVGIESAIGLRRAGKDVTVIEMASDMENLRASAGSVAMELFSQIEELKIPVRLDCRLEEVTDTGVICRDTKTGARMELPADTVLLAVGVAARHDVADSLRRSAPETEVFVVGDALQVGNIASAVMSGFKAAAYI